MRLLHTSDWHLGRTLAGRARTDEFAAVLDEVIGIARDERVDCVLLSGDVYEHKVASPEADRLLFDTLVRLHREGVAMVAIPGNHESPERWRALAPLLREIQVRAVTEVRRPEQGGAVEVASRDGREVAYIACVPFVPERQYGSTRLLFERTERWSQEYAQGLSDLMHAMCAQFRPDRVNILMGHLFVDGARLGGGETEVTVGPECAVPPERLPASPTYIALGHIHRAQRIERSPAPARYAGSLLQLDFGERDQQKSVTLVEASPGRPAVLREIPLRSGRSLRDVEGTLDELRERAAELGDSWLRVRVRTGGQVPGIADRVREILPHAVQVIPTYDRAEGDPLSPALATLQPREQFSAYHRAEHGGNPSPEMLATFTEVLDLVTEESR